MLARKEVMYAGILGSWRRVLYTSAKSNLYFYKSSSFIPWNSSYKINLNSRFLRIYITIATYFLAPLELYSDMDRSVI